MSAVRFETLFGYPSEAEFRMPGRVHLLGRPGSGPVLTAPLPQSLTVYIAPNNQDNFRIVSGLMGENRTFRLSEPPDALPETTGGWLEQVLRVFLALREREIHVPCGDIFIDSDLETGLGLASSAAFVTGILKAGLKLAGETMDAQAVVDLVRQLDTHPQEEAADIFACVTGETGQVSLLEEDLFCKTQTIPDTFCFVLLHSGQPFPSAGSKDRLLEPSQIYNAFEALVAGDVVTFGSLLSANARKVPEDLGALVALANTYGAYGARAIRLDKWGGAVALIAPGKMDDWWAGIRHSRMRAQLLSRFPARF